VGFNLALLEELALGGLGVLGTRASRFLCARCGRLSALFRLSTIGVLCGCRLTSACSERALWINSF
jgi:hypothetical protein